MATGSLINGDTTLNSTFTLNKATNTLLTLQTAGKYIEKVIELTLNAQTASPSFDGGALNNKAATATFTNMTTSASNTSGVAIVAAGTAGRDAVLYNGAVEGWVSKDDNDPAIAALPTDTWNGTTYYATGVTMTAPSSGTRQFSITVPNGLSDPLTFTFIVDTNGNTVVNGTADSITWATGGNY